MSDVTNSLPVIGQGDLLTADSLLPLIYDELRRLADRRLALEKPGQTLQATALVNEVYLRLVDGDPDRRWEGRATSSVLRPRRCLASSSKTPGVRPGRSEVAGSAASS
jgi:hypothetical protein